MQPRKVHVLATSKKLATTLSAVNDSPFLEVTAITQIGCITNPPPTTLLLFTLDKAYSSHADLYIINTNTEELAQTQNSLLQSGIDCAKICILDTKQGSTISQIERMFSKRWPDFVIAGAQKSGTTWLQKNLQKYPDIYMPEGEINFFGLEWDKGSHYYLNALRGGTSNQLIGEKSTVYLPYPGAYESAPKQLYSCSPQTKIIICLRNPVDRLVSAMWHNARYGFIKLNLENFDSNFVTNGMVRKHQYDGALIRGQYIQGIESLLSFFSLEQIHIVIYEETVLSNDPKRLSPVLKFLQLEENYSFEDLDQPIYKNPNKNKSLSPEARKELLAHYKPYNEKLFKLIGRTIQSWNQ